ncbi:ABC transporter ATP-binding protein [Paenibacillus pini]|uniref:Quaternary amine transport ATP-binding protein n=1 Tax=Paenibacillus pini JCM 16418 TaxID=1236976 RepID=W7YSL9_9BACL|nr:ABC transporter ATP-binding protein [Paenibacillus pini]GAF07626.1 glycine betaine ABC transport system [Paenibacillus pini JCM 16418]
MIRFDNVSKKYPDGTSAVRSLDLEIKDGEFFVIIGPSGCGKTTTLKMINRLIDLSDGTVWINDKKISEYDIHELRWNLGYVLQQIALFPHMTIGENIAIVPELRKWNREKIAKRVDELLDMVGLEPEKYRDRKPGELSGGQQQRVGVIRALAADPGIILMDEPFSALDPFSRDKLQDDVLDLQQRIKKTIVFVTHDIHEAMKLGDRICVMKDGQIVQVGTPSEILNNPVNDFVKDFVGVQKDKLDQNLDIDEIISPLREEDMNLKLISAVPASASLQEVLNLLCDKDQLPVERNGELVGTISRQNVIQHMAERMQERGQRNG